MFTCVPDEIKDAQTIVSEELHRRIGILDVFPSASLENNDLVHAIEYLLYTINGNSFAEYITVGQWQDMWNDFTTEVSARNLEEKQSMATGSVSLVMEMLVRMGKLVKFHLPGDLYTRLTTSISFTYGSIGDWTSTTIGTQTKEEHEAQIPYQDLYNLMQSSYWVTAYLLLTLIDVNPHLIQLTEIKKRIESPSANKFTADSA